MNAMRVLLLCTIGFMVAPVYAATLCVAPGGANGCADKLSTAAAAASPGDTIKVAKGTYFDAATINDAGVIVQGSGSIIDGHGMGAPAINVTAANVTITGMVVANTDNVPAVQVNGDGFIFTKNVINNSAAAFNCLNISGENALVTSNKFFGCGGTGVNVSGGNSVISGNQFLIGDGTAIKITGNTATAKKNLCETVDDSCVSISGNDALVKDNKNFDSDNDVYTVSGNNAHVEHNTAFGSYYPVVSVTGQNPQVLKNVALRVQDDIPYNVTCNTNCSTALVSGNKADGASADDECYSLTFNANGGKVLGNIALHCSNEGFKIAGSGALLVTGNKAIKVGVGKDAGFDISGTGIKTLESNQASYAGGAGFKMSGTALHVLTGNTSTKNRDGFLLDATTTGEQLLGNKATANIEEGIENLGAGNSFGNNKATGNRFTSDFCSPNAFTDLGGNVFGSTTMTCVSH